MFSYGTEDHIPRGMKTQVLQHGNLMHSRNIHKDSIKTLRDQFQKTSIFGQRTHGLMATSVTETELDKLEMTREVAAEAT